MSTRERAMSLLRHIYARSIEKFYAGKGGDRPDIQSYEPSPNDLVVTSTAKAGTTLVQYMTYLITKESGNAKPTEFSDINEVAPWVDLHIRMQTPIPSPDECQIRVLKTHSARNVFIDNGKTVQKHIVLLRDPMQYPSSLLDFLYLQWTRNYTKDKEALNDDEVKEELMNLIGESELLLKYMFKEEIENDEKIHLWGEINWFNVVKSWLLPQPYPNTLILFYEDVVKDIENTIRRIASFGNCKLNEDQVKNIAHLCSREQMINDSRFGAKIASKAFGMDTSLVKRVKKERSDGFKAFKLKQHIIEGINERFTNEFGVSSYDALKDRVNKKQFELYQL